MKLKLATALALGVLGWAALLSPAVRQAPVASADPVGVVEPVTASATQTFTFSFEGFQPYTPLTLSFLPPGAPEFTIIPTPVPVITDGLGRAQFPLSLPTLIDPTTVAIALPGVPLYVTWGTAPIGPVSFRADACDRVNCVEFIGSFTIS